MTDISIRELTLADKEAFLAAMQRSQTLHQPWVMAPLTDTEFDEFYERAQQPKQKCFLVCQADELVGVFNVNEIVRGFFQNAYLGFYAVADNAGKGYMSQGLKLVLHKVFHEMKLHRLEANIQPDNVRSIRLVQKNSFRYEGFSPRYLYIDGQWRGHERWAITHEDFIREDRDVVDKDAVAIVPYDTAWPEMAEHEMEKLRAILPASKIIDMQHVGSTAIPGMSAKPIIDIQIAVSCLDDMKLMAVPLLQKLGYEYWDANPDATRMFFVRGMPPYGAQRTHHVHIVEPTSKHWHDKLLFRDYLCAHTDIAQAYEHLKHQLAEQHTYDREAYTDAKGDFVRNILSLAKKNKL